MSKDGVDWMLIEVAGYDISKGIIKARNISNGEIILVSKAPDQSRDWVGWLADPSRSESAPQGSILALYNLKSGSVVTGATHTAGWGTTITKDLTSNSIIVAPLSINRSIQVFPDSKKKFIDGILLDNRSTFIEHPDQLKQAIANAIDETPTPLVSRRGFMVRAVSETNPDQGLIEAFYGVKNMPGAKLFEHHWNRQPASGSRKNRLEFIADAIRFNNADKSGLAYEIVGFSQAICNTFSDRQMQALADMPHYKISKPGAPLPEQAFSWAAVVVDSNRPNQIKHHLPLPRASVKNSLFGVLPASDLQQRVIGVITLNGADSQYVRRASSPSKRAVEYPLSIEDYVNKVGQIRSFRVLAPDSEIERYAARLESAIPGVKPFKIADSKSYSFPIEFKKQIQASLSDLTGAPPLYLREITIDGNERLIIDGRTSSPEYQPFLSRLKASIPHAVDPAGRPTFDLASYNQIATQLNTLSPAVAPPVTKPSIPTPAVAAPAAKATPAATESPKETASPTKQTKVSFADWLENKFLGRYDAMIDYLYTDISNFAAEHAKIDWSHSANSYSIESGASRGELVKGASRVKPLPGNKDHAGSVAYAINTFEKSDPKFKNPIRWFNINLINKKLNREGAFVFNGYEYLKNAYERDNNLEISTNTQQRLQELEQARLKRAQEAERKHQAQLQLEQASRDQWMKRFPGLKDEDGSSAIFEKKKLDIVLGHIDLKQGVDTNLGRYTAIRLHDIDNNFRGVQQLFAKSWIDKKDKPENKLFTLGTQFKDGDTDISFGTHAVIGKIDPRKPVFFSEGFSTGASIFEATGTATVVALNANNLFEVVGAYRRAYPQAQLVIVADNDSWKPLKGNTGVMAAVRASFEHQAHYVVPEFSNSLRDKTPTDANDLRVLVGLDALQVQLATPRQPVPDRISYETLIIQNCGLESLSSKIEDLTTHSESLNKEAALRRFVHAALTTYGKNEVLNYLTPEFKGIVSFDPPSSQPVIAASHVKQPDVEILEAVSPSEKKYCFIRDNTGGQHTDAINQALQSVVGKNALSYNASLKGWVAPYPTMNIMKSYLHEETGSPRLYIGKARASATEEKFVVRGNFEDTDFQEAIAKKIAFAEPKYIKGEFGLVVDKPHFLEHVKRRLADYLAPKLNLPEPALQKDAQQIQIEELIARARSVSGQDNASIVRATYRLTSGMYPAIFKDDDYVFAGLYARSIESLNATPTPQLHLKAVDAAAGLYITLDRQGVLDGLLSAEMRAQTKGLCMQVKAMNKGLSLIDDSVLSQLADKYDLPKETTRTCLAGDASPSQLPNGAPTQLLSDIRRELSVISYSALSKKADNKLEPQFPAQPDRIATLLELTDVAARKGYSLEEYQEIFLRSAGSPYHPKGGSFNPALLQTDIVFLEKKQLITEPHAPITTEAGLFDMYVEKASSERLSQYREYIQAMIAERGHLTYESFSSYLKGKRDPITQAPNPYLMEGEFNEDLLSHDVARLTMYKNHQALYQEFGAEVAAKPKDIFSTPELTEKPSASTAAPVVPGCKLIQSDAKIEEISIPINIVSGDGFEIYRVRESLQNKAGESIAIDAWFSSKETIAPYISNARSLEPNDDVKPGIEIDVIQHVTRQGVTFALAKTVSEPEVYFFSGGHPAVEDKRNFATLDRNEAEQQYTSTKLEMLKGEEQSLSQTRAKPTLVEFIQESVRSSVSPEAFTIALTESFGVGINDALKQSICDQYGLLLAKANERQAEPSNRFERLQSAVSRYIRDGLDYDDIYEDLLKPDGCLVENNPYFSGGKIDKKGVVADLQQAGFVSIKSLYDSLYQVAHGNPVNHDAIPRPSTLLPATIVSDAPLNAQFESLRGVVHQHNLQSLSFEQYNFPTLPEWKRMPNSMLPIHPILAVDLNAQNAIDTLKKFDISAIKLLADVHAVGVQSTEPNELASSVVDQWAIRTRVSRLTIDEMKDLSKDEREEIALALGISSLRARSVSAKAISEHLSHIEAIGCQRMQEYSYIVGALAYEERFDRVPAYAARDIAKRIELSADFGVQIEQQRADRQMIRHDASAAIAVISAVSSIERQSFDADCLRQLEVVSSSGRDYIGSYKHFYKAVGDRINLPREVSHHGVYEGMIYGLPYAISTEECHSSGLTPLSKAAVSNVMTSIDGWLTEFGALGLESRDTGSLFVLSKVSDRYLLLKHDTQHFTNIQSAHLSELLAGLPTDLLHFADRNSVSEEVGKRLANQMQCSYIDIECRLANRSQSHADTLQSLREHPSFNQFFAELGQAEDREAIHYIARRAIENTASELLSSHHQSPTPMLEALIAKLPPPAPLPIQDVETLSRDSLKTFVNHGYEIAGVSTGSDQFKALTQFALTDHTFKAEKSPTAFHSIRPSEELIDKITETVNQKQTKAPALGDHLFITSSAGANLCARVVGFNERTLIVTSEKLESAIAHIAQMNPEQRAAVIGPHLQINGADAEIVTNQSNTLEKRIDNLNLFQLRSFAERLGIDAQSDRSTIALAINERSAKGSAIHNQALELVTEMEADSKKLARTKLGLPEINGTLDLSSRTLELSSAAIKYQTLLPAKAYEFEAYSSLADFANASRGENLDRRANAYATAYFADVQVGLLLKVSDSLHNGHDYVCIKNGDRHGWAFSGPNGLITSIYDTLPSVVTETANARAIAAAAPNHDMEPDRVSMLHRGVLVDGERLSSQANSPEGLSLVRLSINDSSQILAVRESAIIAATTSELEMGYERVTQGFKGPFDELVLQLKEDLANLPKTATAKEQAIAAYCMHRAHHEMDTAIRLMDRSGSSIELTRNGTSFTLREGHQQQGGGITTDFSTLPAIESHLLALKRSDLRKQFAEEVKIEPSGINQYQTLSNRKMSH